MERISSEELEEVKKYLDSNLILKINLQKSNKNPKLALPSEFDLNENK